MAGIFHRIEVIEVAKELIEAVHRRQELVLVAKMVLAELAGGIAHCALSAVAIVGASAGRPVGAPA